MPGRRPLRFHLLQAPIPIRGESSPTLLARERATPSPHFPDRGQTLLLTRPSLPRSHRQTGFLPSNPLDNIFTSIRFRSGLNFVIGFLDVILSNIYYICSIDPAIPSAFRQPFPVGKTADSQRASAPPLPPSRPRRRTSFPIRANSTSSRRNRVARLSAPSPPTATVGPPVSSGAR